MNNKHEESHFTKFTLWLSISVFFLIGLSGISALIDHIKTEPSVGNFFMLLIFGIVPVWVSIMCFISQILYDGNLEKLSNSKVGKITAVFNLLVILPVSLGLIPVVTIFFDRFVRLNELSKLGFKDTIATLFLFFFIYGAYKFINLVIKYNIRMLKNK